MTMQSGAVFKASNRAAASLIVKALSICTSACGDIRWASTEEICELPKISTDDRGFVLPVSCPRV